LRSDLIHRPGVGTSLGKAGIKTHPKQYNLCSIYCEAGKAALKARQPSWLGRVGPS